MYKLARLAPIVALMAALAILSPSQGRQNKPKSKTEAGRRIEIKSVDMKGNSIEAKGEDGLRTYYATEDTEFVINGKTKASFSDLAVGKILIVRYEINEKIPRRVLSRVSILDFEVPRTRLQPGDSPDDIRPDQLRVGLAGKLPFYVKIVQIVDESNARISYGPEQAWLKGFSTKNMVDDKFIKIDDWVEIRETKQYKTILGGSKTVFVIEPETEAHKEKRVKQERAKEEERKQREAEDLERSRKQTEKADSDKAAAKTQREKEALAKARATREKAAASKVSAARLYLTDGNKAKARERLQQVIDEYPDTQAAAEAKKLLKDLEN